MTNVLKQSKKTPKVPRCFGSGTQIRGGPLGVVVLVARFSIYFSDRYRQQVRQSEEGGYLHGYERAATYTRGYCMHFKFDMGRCQYAGNDSGYSERSLKYARDSSISRVSAP